MRSSTLLLTLLPLAEALNVVISNDDGWAEINIREFYNALNADGFNAVISAPAENESGTGSSDRAPTTVGSSGCEFASCPPGSPAYGFNASMPRFNYVNSYPVTSMRYGIQNVSEEFFGGPPDIAVAGPNVGNNLGIAVLGSGTVGAATEAVKEGIAGIAFSGKDGSQTAWNTTVQPYETIYAQLATAVARTLVSAGEPYLPPGIWLNVNFPSVTDTCSSAADFRFVLSRIFWTVVHNDVHICGNGGQLPTESSVISHPGCFASISVGVANYKVDAGADAQMFVANQLSDILTCLPER